MPAARSDNGHVVRVAAYPAAMSRQNAMAPFRVLAIARSRTADSAALDSSIFGTGVEYLGIELEGSAVARRPLTMKGWSDAQKL